MSLVGSLAVKYQRGNLDFGRFPGTGFDCSGFVGFVLAESGVFVPDYIDANGLVQQIRHANEYWDHYGIAVHHGLHLPGDLIFFSRNGFFPHHVGIVRDEESYIHSPGKDNQKVRVEPIIVEKIVMPSGEDTPRIVYNQNPIGYKSPTIALPQIDYRYVQKCL